MPPFLLQQPGKRMTIEPDEKPTFTQEDLAEIETEGEDDGVEAGKEGAEQTGDAAAKGQDAKTGDEKTGGKTLADGADVEADDKAKTKAEDDAANAKAADRQAQAKQLREALANHYAAGDKKAYAKELKRLERLGIERPEQVYGLYRDLDNKLNGGGLVKLPGKDAKPEDVAEFHKAIGVPEKPEGYIEHIKLENGAVIGEADKPILNSFTEALHKAGAPPSAVNAAANWYYKLQEEAAAAQDDDDDTFRRESEKVVKEEFGPAFNRKANNIASLFTTAPGGADSKNPNSLYNRLVNGRTADGKLIGNDPDVMRWLIGMADDVNPIRSVTEDGTSSVKSVEKELEELQAMRRADKKKYYSDAVQAREAELMAARDKFQARQRA
jgi:hypothetical protein